MKTLMVITTGSFNDKDNHQQEIRNKFQDITEKTFKNNCEYCLFPSDKLDNREYINRFIKKNISGVQRIVFFSQVDILITKFIYKIAELGIKIQLYGFHNDNGNHRLIQLR